MAEELLQVRNLQVNVEDKQILHSIDLDIKPGETHVLMGPNGAGKSTLGYALMGNPIRVQLVLVTHRSRTPFQIRNVRIIIRHNQGSFELPRIAGIDAAAVG